MAGHVSLETGVDALFLANISVERLPFVTIGIAVLALAASRAQLGRDHRAGLIALQVIAALGTFGLWWLVAIVHTQDWVFYVLYLWSGLITSLIVVRFWLFLAEFFTIIEAKRLFASIAMGGSVGALLGAGIAALLAQSMSGDMLLVASSSFFAASLFGPCLVLPTQKSSEPSSMVEEGRPGPELAASLRRLRESPYAMRVAGLVVVGGMTLTLGDYLFKSVVADEIEVDQLAVTLSRVYLALNILSISMLAIGVTPILRRLGVDRSLAVLPAAVGLAGIGVLVGGALAATIFLKTADGTLRYSLHKTTTELLFLPMSSRLRNAVKGVIDIVGQAAAKAIGSVIILFLVVWPEPRLLVASVLVMFAGVWLIAALRLRHAYLDNFRDSLSEGLIETAIEYPELDLVSAGSLIRAISDPDERRAMAAMRLLVERDQVALIPSLVLYHPSARVVAFALDTFALARRDDLSHFFDHLLDHEESVVRAATVRASWVLERDASRLHDLQHSACLVVRLSATAGLVALGEAGSEQYGRILNEAIEYENSDPRLAAAMAARLDYQPILRESLMRIALDSQEAVAREAIRAIRESQDDWYTGPLVSFLGERRIREDVREALIERGRDALTVLSDALTSEDTHYSVLRHIPRTIARFGSVEAANFLITSLSSVRSGMVRYKVLRGLEMLLLGRGMPGSFVSIGHSKDLNTEAIHQEFDRTLARSLDLLRMEVALTRAQAEDVALGTPGGLLLVELLEDKRTLAVDRLFTILGLLYPAEDFRVIWNGLESESAADRASAAELIETLLPHEVAMPILGLVAPATAQERLSAADADEEDDIEDFSTVMRTLSADGSHSVRMVAVYYADDLGFDLEADERTSGRQAEQSGSVSTGLNLKDRAASILRILSDTSGLRTETLASALRSKG